MSLPKAMKYKKDYSTSRLQRLTCLMQSDDQYSVQDAVNVLAGGLWFETLRDHLHQTTAYAVGKQVQPNTYHPRVNGRWPQHHNLWAKYACGVHLPGADTVLAGHQVAPRSGDILTSAVWKILNTSLPIGDSGDELLRRLHFGVQQAVFKPSLTYGHYARRSAPNLPLKLLECQADLDAVAATVVLLREAHAVGNRRRAFEIGRSLHATLLMVTTYMPLCDIASEFIEFCISKIFPLATDDEVAFDLDQAEFFSQMRCFSRELVRLEDQGRIKNGDSGSQRRRVLSFEFGFDLYFGLGPRWKLVKAPENSTAEARKFVGSMKIARNWGLASLQRGRIQRLIPDEVATQMASIR